MNSLIIMPSFWGILLGLGSIGLFILLFPLIRGKKSNAKKIIIFTITSLYCSVALALYGLWGASDQVVHQVALQKISDTLFYLSHNKPSTAQNVLVKFEQLESTIAYSHVALARLGTIYIEIGLFDKAIESFARAQYLSPHDPDYPVQWIYSHSLLNHGKLPQPVREFAQNLLSQNISPLAVVNLLAIDDYSQGRYQQAIIGWKMLLETDSTITMQKRDVLLKAIENAKHHLPPSVADALDSNNNIRCQVSVSVDPRMIGAIHPEDIVFVFMKSIGGQAAPLAAIKKHAKDLPFTVNLGNQQSMLRGNQLTKGMRVQIIAKISKSGDPLARNGDLRGISKPIVIKPDMNPVDISINEMVS